MHENASLEDFLEVNDTVVFLIIRDDMILFESYYGGYSA